MPELGELHKRTHEIGMILMHRMNAWTQENLRNTGKEKKSDDGDKMPEIGQKHKTYSSVKLTGYNNIDM